MKRRKSDRRKLKITQENGETKKATVGLRNAKSKSGKKALKNNETTIKTVNKHT